MTIFFFNYIIVNKLYIFIYIIKDIIGNHYYVVIEYNYINFM